MENRTIFLVYLTTWCGYLIAVHGLAYRRRLGLGVVSASHFAPTTVALAMGYIFLIRRGVTVAQFAAGSEPGMDLWSLWVHLWPLLLLLTAASALAQLIWTIAACFQKAQRKWIPLAIAGFLMSVFAFLTVGANFPDA